MTGMGLDREGKTLKDKPTKCRDSKDCPFCPPELEKHSLDISKYNILEIQITKHTKLNIDHKKYKLTLQIEPDEDGMGVITHTGGL